METAQKRSPAPQAGTPAAPRDAAEARRQWQASMAAQQRAGGMDTAQMQAQRRAEVLRRPASTGPSAAPAQRSAEPTSQRRPVRISRAAGASTTAQQASPAPAKAPAAPIQSPAAPAKRPAAPAGTDERPHAPAKAPAAPMQTSAAPQKAAARARSPLLRVLTVLGRAVRTVLFTAFTAVKAAALLLIPLFMFWYGYTIDRNGWFQGDQYEREIALAMLDGESISNFGEMDERQIIKLCAQNMAEAPHAIALGSSRILQLDRTLTHDNGFFNAGMIGAEYADVYDSYYLFDRVDKIPDIVVFGVDPWLFSGGPDANTFKRVDMQMWNEYRRFALGQTDVEVTVAEENMNYWLALTSPAFFRETMDYYIDNKENGLRPSIVEGDVMRQPTDIKRPDGSLLYGMDFRTQTVEQSNEAAQVQFQNTLVNCEEFYELDAEHIAMFEQFIAYMRAKGSEVVLYLSPFHNNCYNWILNFPQRYSGFFQVENWLRQYAAQNGIPVYGSYDPEAVGCDESDFFDGWHVRDTGIAKFFPGLPSIEAARAAGTLPDPLAVSPRMPTATEDPIL